MRHETAGVTEILLESAKKEFLEYGFYEASLRRIATKSEVSTNSIYTRFHDKTGLFNAVVKEAADGLMEIYLKSVNEARKTLDVEQAMQIGGEGTDIVLKHIYKYKDEFKLIFCCSVGTEYEDYFDKLAAIEESYYKQFAKQFSNGNIVLMIFSYMCIAEQGGSMFMKSYPMTRVMRKRNRIWIM